jgi:dTDP-glucose 4,6-dehydratase
MEFIVTGGAGFIGSHFVELLVEQGHKPIVIDALTYAGRRENLQHLPAGSYEFLQMNICNAGDVAAVLKRPGLAGVFNFAAETHVDRSISGPADFMQTNVVGTYVLLNEALKAWEARGRDKNFRYVQVSTDEVFGQLGDEGAFTEATPYAPNSPYSSSKAGADLLVRAWHHTYGLPTITTHCSNNYGSRQYPEKLIPAMVSRALRGDKLGVYGDGKNVRDWLHAKDHCRGIWLAFSKGVAGESYCFGGNHELENLTLVHALCDLLDKERPRAGGASYRELIQFVPDRLGHDRRYAIDFSKARTQLGYAPSIAFADGFRDTVKWYLDNSDWVKRIRA